MRQRVLDALSHSDPGSIPLDFGAHRSSGIMAMAYPALRQALGLEPRTVRVYDVIQQLAVIDDDVLNRLGVDTIELGRGFALDAAEWTEWTLPDGSPCVVPVWALPVRGDACWELRSPRGTTLARMPDGAAYFDQVWWPWADGGDSQPVEEAFAESMWTGIGSPPGPHVGVDDALAAGAKALRARTDRAIVGLFGGNLFEIAQFLYRTDRFLMMLGDEPARVHAFLDRLVERHAAALDRYLAAVGDSIDIVAFGDDLGGQNGPIISPRMYREFFQPRHAFLFRRAKERAPHIRVMLHCCGGVRPLLNDLIEAGLDAINPVQIAARGMEAEGLKRDFGSRLTFWGGGCDTQRVLPFGTPEEVRMHVKAQIEAFRPGGGFVFQQVHNIQSGIPAANIVAMFDAVREFGRTGE